MTGTRSAGGEDHQRSTASFAAAKLTESHRERLMSLVTDGRLSGARWLHRLRAMGTLEGFPACSSVVHLLTHLDLDEAEAESLLVRLLRHREELRGRLDRDPGLQVAALDFLCNVEPRLRNPAVVELAKLQETERDAVTDPLTDLYNRRFFDGALETEIRRSRRYGPELSLLILDLDSFKSVNDLYGHPFGDRVLRRTGHLIRRAVRESDTACRFGGDEFAVILPETDRTGAYTVAERVRVRIETTFSETPVDGRLVAMTVSGGIACYPRDAGASEPLIHRADRALYQGKTTGVRRNSTVVYHQEKRRSVRFPVRDSSNAVLALPARGRTAAVRAVDLSRDGVLVEGAPPCGVDERVELTLDGASASLTIRGRVVRVESGSGGEERIRLAVVFEEPPREERLRCHVARGRPRRPPKRERP